MRIVPSACCHDCGGNCPLNIYVEDGRIIRIEAHDVGHPAMRPCSRGLLYHHRVYAPDRLKYPMKRTGERGEGKFARVSWDEALDEVAQQITRIRDTYGPASLLNLSFSGSGGTLHYGGAALMRFLNMVGGQTSRWGGASYQGALFASLATYGREDTGNGRADLLNSRMIILWGCNPAESIFGTETRWYLTQAREKGIRIVSIDPRYTESAATWASAWIPIRPGTDAALAVAMAYVIVEGGRHDQRFLDRCAVGFNEFRRYLFGEEDGVAKTPSWAEAITGVPAETIRGLAMEYATTKPAAILCGFAPGRTSRGEQYHRATAALSAMTGNVGVPGGSAACFDQMKLASSPREKGAVADFFLGSSFLPVLVNPVEKGLPPHEYSIKGIRNHTVSKVHPSRMWDAMLKGKGGGYFADLKLAYIIGGDGVNQFPDTNRAVEALRKMEFVVVHDHFVTPTARFADILLPATTWCERNDIRIPWVGMGRYVTYINKAIGPLYEAKSDIDIFAALAGKMGLPSYNDKTEDEWLRLVAARVGISDYEAFKRSGFHKMPDPEVAFQDQVRDPVSNPFPTPSGKMEIFCQRIADFNRPDDLPAIPKYVAGWEGPEDPARQRYPLQLITTHSRKRTHSQFHNIPVYRRNEPHQVWMNPVDAGQRGIRNGELVKVFNDRGAVTISARLTGRIMPGVVSIYQGAWYDPDESGTDRGGCVNVLNRAEHSPGGAFASNTALVQVERTKDK